MQLGFPKAASPDPSSYAPQRDLIRSGPVLLLQIPEAGGRGGEEEGGEGLTLTVKIPTPANPNPNPNPNASAGVSRVPFFLSSWDPDLLPKGF